MLYILNSTTRLGFMDHLPFLIIKYAANCRGKLAKGRREQPVYQIGCKFVRNMSKQPIVVVVVGLVKVYAKANSLS